eukprot:TRINITY_DN2071_c1_g1_i1.p1 TRINITY_DN2071_c1_g1~~TRINITY_DN2071_c1_g1_i1.p1  ORF type:complete len:1068 (+),score=333.61 TRINITY_DN2071_c1_g1_i1:68-3205(+)
MAARLQQCMSVGAVCAVLRPSLSAGAQLRAAYLAAAAQRIAALTAPRGGQQPPQGRGWLAVHTAGPQREADALLLANACALAAPALSASEAAAVLRALWESGALGDPGLRRVSAAALWPRVAHATKERAAEEWAALPQWMGACAAAAAATQPPCPAALEAAGAAAARVHGLLSRPEGAAPAEQAPAEGGPAQSSAQAEAPGDALSAEPAPALSAEPAPGEHSSPAGGAQLGVEAAEVAAEAAAEAAERPFAEWQARLAAAVLRELPPLLRCVKAERQQSQGADSHRWAALDGALHAAHLALRRAAHQGALGALDDCRTARDGVVGLVEAGHLNMARGIAESVAVRLYVEHAGRARELSMERLANLSEAFACCGAVWALRSCCRSIAQTELAADSDLAHLARAARFGAENGAATQELVELLGEASLEGPSPAELSPEIVHGLLWAAACCGASGSRSLLHAATINIMHRASEYTPQALAETMLARHLLAFRQVHEMPIDSRRHPAASAAVVSAAVGSRSRAGMLLRAALGTPPRLVRQSRPLARGVAQQGETVMFWPGPRNVEYPPECSPGRVTFESEDGGSPPCLVRWPSGHIGRVYYDDLHPARDELALLQGTWLTRDSATAAVRGTWVRFLDADGNALSEPRRLDVEGGTAALMGCSITELTEDVVRWSDGDIWSRRSKDILDGRVGDMPFLSRHTGAILEALGDQGALLRWAVRSGFFDNVRRAAAGGSAVGLEVACGGEVLVLRNEAGLALPYPAWLHTLHGGSVQTASSHDWNRAAAYYSWLLQRPEDRIGAAVRPTAAAVGNLRRAAAAAAGGAVAAEDVLFLSGSELCRPPVRFREAAPEGGLFGEEHLGMANTWQSSLERTLAWLGVAAAAREHTVLVAVPDAGCPVSAASMLYMCDALVCVAAKGGRGATVLVQVPADYRPHQMPLPGEPAPEGHELGRVRHFNAHVRRVATVSSEPEVDCALCAAGWAEAAQRGEELLMDPPGCLADGAGSGRSVHYWVLSDPDGGGSDPGALEAAAAVLGGGAAPAAGADAHSVP